MNAITLRNPRAAAVVFGYDRDVLRRETTRHRGVVLIHAGKEYDTRARAWSLPHEDLRQHAIGYVLLDQVRRRNDGWYAWDFKHPHVFPEPFEMRGLPGLFRVEASDQLLEQLQVAMKPDVAKKRFRYYEQLINPDSVHPRRPGGWVGD